MPRVKTKIGSKVQKNLWVQNGQEDEDFLALTNEAVKNIELSMEQARDHYVRNKKINIEK